MTHPTLQSEREMFEKEMNHPLYSENMRGILKAKTLQFLTASHRRILQALLEKCVGEKWIFSRSSNAFYEKKTGAIRTNEPSSADIHNAAITRVEQIINELLEV